MSNPEKGYHLEFACNEKVHAQILIDEMSFFGIDARMTLRKRYFVVYVKEGAAISDLLSIMGAPVSMMSFENDRILRDVRNSVNRKVNCETANLAKTVNAASKQVQDIQLIEETIGLEELPTSLQEMAEVRLAYPDATLTELGNYLDPPVGKSGVNHRLRKLGEIASKLRE
jgi:DNA-binding protein WhiA